MFLWHVPVQCTAVSVGKSHPTAQPDPRKCKHILIIIVNWWYINIIISFKCRIYNVLHFCIILHPLILGLLGRISWYFIWILCRRLVLCGAGLAHLQWRKNCSLTLQRMVLYMLINPNTVEKHRCRNPSRISKVQTAPVASHQSLRQCRIQVADVCWSDLIQRLHNLPNQSSRLTTVKYSDDLKISVMLLLMLHEKSKIRRAGWQHVLHTVLHSTAARCVCRDCGSTFSGTEAAGFHTEPERL